MLSRFSSWDETRRDPALEQGLSRKTQELLAYLLLFRNRPHPFRKLAASIWPDIPGGQTGVLLQRSAAQLQAAIADAGGYARQMELTRGEDWLQLNLAPTCWMDVCLLEQAAGCCRAAPSCPLSRELFQALEQAVGLYKGPLLEGWYCEWCLPERDRLQQDYLDILDALIDACESRGKYEEGLCYGYTALRCERTCERAYRKMMRLYYLSGDRSAALRQFLRCAEVLGEELQVKPGRETCEIYDLIRADQIDRMPGVFRANPALTRTRALPEMLVDLQSLQHNLAHALDQLQI